MALPLTHTYARLPERFHAKFTPPPAAAPRLIRLNETLAHHLGLSPEELTSPTGLQTLAGSHTAEGSEPIALAYAGHQFGHFVPQLGDGRAVLLGEVVAADGLRYDIQLKGSGPTSFSRRGDGRAALGPVLREYILSEAMFALGVPTTRALAAVTTGATVYRETTVPGAVFTRVAASHIRVGTFQYFAARQDIEALDILSGYAIARHYPEAAQQQHPCAAFLTSVIARQARLIAQWMLLGFIHGVMNTDNMAISGETIDYGPCAFMEAYDPDQVFSSIDAKGRYAFSNQPAAAHWNLTRLAEALLPLLYQEAGSEDAGMTAALDALATFTPLYEAARLTGLRRKLGLAAEHSEDAALADDLLTRMAANHADFTLTFRHLCDAAASPGHDDTVRSLFSTPAAVDTWLAAWRNRLRHEPASPTDRAAAMRRANPAFLPRNHFVQAVIDAAVADQDFQPFEDLLNATSRPFDDRPELARYTVPASPTERVLQTFCGT